jgi:hypothetical protein
MELRRIVTDGRMAGKAVRSRRMGRLTRYVRRFLAVLCLLVSIGLTLHVKIDRRAAVETSDDRSRAAAVIVMQQTDPAAPSQGL